MKGLVLLASAVALLVSPVIAQNAGTKTPPKAPAPTTQAAPKATPGHGPNDVWCGSEYVGSSPDANIRQEMLRDFKHGCD